MSKMGQSPKYNKRATPLEKFCYDKFRVRIMVIWRGTCWGMPNTPAR